MPALAELSVGRLKKLAAYHAVSIQGCLEKAEMVAALLAGGIPNKGFKEPDSGPPAAKAKAKAQAKFPTAPAAKVQAAPPVAAASPEGSPTEGSPPASPTPEQFPRPAPPPVARKRNWQPAFPPTPFTAPPPSPPPEDEPSKAARRWVPESAGGEEREPEEQPVHRPMYNKASTFKVWVGNLAISVTPRELAEHVGTLGFEPMEVNMLPKKPEAKRGMAVVSVDSKEEQGKMIRLVDDTLLAGNRLQADVWWDNSEKSQVGGGNWSGGGWGTGGGPGAPGDRWQGKGKGR